MHEQGKSVNYMSTVTKKAKNYSVLTTKIIFNIDY